MRHDRLSQSLPDVGVLKSYQSRWLAKDVVAGLVLSALLVPQGMAYAELAGLPAVTGLYTSILPLMGAGGDPARAVALASMLALFTGAAMVLAGVCKLGFIADLLSKPTMLGYMNGLALTILVGQLPKLFGFSIDADGFIAALSGFISGLSAGEVVAAAAAIGIASLVLMMSLQ